MVYKIKEGSNYVLMIKPLIDISKFTISVRAYKTTDADGTTTELGRKAGVLANVPVSISLRTKTLSTGIYRLEIYGDFGSDSQISLNNDNEYITLIIENMGGI